MKPDKKVSSTHIFINGNELKVCPICRNNINNKRIHSNYRLYVQKQLAQIKHGAAKQRTVIVLEGTGSQIENLGLYLYERGIHSEYVIDEGVNEIPTMSITALATEQMDISDEDNRKMLKGFTLYKHGMFQR